MKRGIISILAVLCCGESLMAQQLKVLWEGYANTKLADIGTMDSHFLQTIRNCDSAKILDITFGKQTINKDTTVYEYSLTGTIEINETEAYIYTIGTYLYENLPSGTKKTIINRECFDQGENKNDRPMIDLVAEHAKKKYEDLLEIWRDKYGQTETVGSGVVTPPETGTSGSLSGTTTSKSAVTSITMGYAPFGIRQFRDDLNLSPKQKNGDALI